MNELYEELVKSRLERICAEIREQYRIFEVDDEEEKGQKPVRKEDHVGP